MAPDYYSVRMTTCSRHQFQQLSPELRALALRELLSVAMLAAQVRPPSLELLQEAEIEPPVLRLTAWPLVIIYDADPERRALTVLHVLCAASRQPAGELQLAAC